MQLLGGSVHIGGLGQLLIGGSIRLERTQKKQSAEYATRRTEVITTRKLGWFGTCRAEKFNPVLTDLEIPKKTNLPKAIVSYCREIAESDGNN